jgi:hypothetical protein
MYSSNEFAKDLAEYRTAFKDADTSKVRRLRDAMIQRIRVEIEINYRQFETLLYSDKAAFNTVFDFAELGLSAATTIVGGAQTKTILAALSTASQGGRLSYDKNWFREKTAETIIAAMEAERNKKLLLIMDKMVKGNAAQYTFEEAWSDLVDYFYAGTLEGGMQALSIETGNTAANAKKDFNDATKKRIASLQPATKEVIMTVEKLTDRLKELYKTNDTTQAKRILDTLKIEVKPGKNDFELLRDQIDAIQPDDSAGLARLWKAFNIKN